MKFYHIQSLSPTCGQRSGGGYVPQKVGSWERSHSSAQHRSRPSWLRGTLWRHDVAGPLPCFPCPPDALCRRVGSPQRSPELLLRTHLPWGAQSSFPGTFLRKRIPSEIWSRKILPVPQLHLRIPFMPLRVRFCVVQIGCCSRKKIKF